MPSFLHSTRRPQETCGRSHSDVLHQKKKKWEQAACPNRVRELQVPRRVVHVCAAAAAAGEAKREGEPTERILLPHVEIKQKKGMPEGQRYLMITHVSDHDTGRHATFSIIIQANYQQSIRSSDVSRI